MSQKKEGVRFSGTPEQEAELKKVIAELKDTKGALMPILQKAQDIYGYLPIEVQTMISDETGIPLEKIYGVSTFYSQFSLQPKGQYPHFRLSRNSLLCQGFRRDLQKAGGNPRHYQRAVHAGRQIFARFLPLRRRLRPGPGHDDQRRSIRPSDGGRHPRHPGEILIYGHDDRAVSQCSRRGGKFRQSRRSPDPDCRRGRSGCGSPDHFH